jgi:hypothetical protein
VSVFVREGHADKHSVFKRNVLERVHQLRKCDSFAFTIAQRDWLLQVNPVFLDLFKMAAHYNVKVKKGKVVPVLN